MFMTDKEASGRMCPMTRSGEMHMNCVGSRCAMWRRGRVPEPKVRHAAVTPDDRFGVEPKRPVNVPESWVFFDYRDEHEGCGWEEPDSERMERWTGYCGMAGKPEAME